MLPIPVLWKVVLKAILTIILGSLGSSFNYITQPVADKMILITGHSFGPTGPTLTLRTDHPASFVQAHFAGVGVSTSNHAHR
jgi:hypothetical protein